MCNYYYLSSPGPWGSGPCWSGPCPWGSGPKSREPAYSQALIKTKSIDIGQDPIPLWNKLPPALRQISESSYELTQMSPHNISPRFFHSKLKTLLFGKSYPDLSSCSSLPPHLNSKHHPP